LKQINDPWGDLVDYFRETTVTEVKYRLISGILEGPMPHAAYVAAATAETPPSGGLVGRSLAALSSRQRLLRLLATSGNREL
jgi:hypothetical protein